MFVANILTECWLQSVNLVARLSVYHKS